MVVLVSSCGGPPPLFCSFHHQDEIVATFVVPQYSWWAFGPTVVLKMPPGYQALVGQEFPTLAAAAAQVHELIFGTTPNYLHSLMIYLTGRLDPEVTVAQFGEKIRPHSKLARAHVISHVTCHESDVGEGRWLELGKGQPYIPHAVPIATALSSHLWNQRPKAVVPRPFSRGDTVTGVADGTAASAKNSDGAAASSRKKRRRMPSTQVGAVLWERDAKGAPPVAYVLKGVTLQPGPSLLELESLAAGRERVWLTTAEVSPFDEFLPRIWNERREELVRLGAWDQTCAMVKQGLLHRQILARSNTVQQIWQHVMGEMPCPLTEAEIADWMRSRMASRVSCSAAVPNSADASGAVPSSAVTLEAPRASELVPSTQPLSEQPPPPRVGDDAGGQADGRLYARPVWGEVGSSAGPPRADVFSPDDGPSVVEATGTTELPSGSSSRSALPRKRQRGDEAVDDKAASCSYRAQLDAGLLINQTRESMAQCRELASELDEQAKLELSQLRKDVPLGPDGKPLQLVDYNLFDDDSFDKDAYGRPPGSVPSSDELVNRPA